MMELARAVRHTYVDADAWRVFDDVVPTRTPLTALGWQHIAGLADVIEIVEGQA